MQTELPRVLDRIAAIGIPTHSYVAAAQSAGQYRERYTVDDYNQAIYKLTGDSNLPMYPLPMAQMVFGYIIQEHVREGIKPTNRTDSAITLDAIKRAAVFVEAEPWHWAGELSPFEVDHPTTTGSADRCVTIKRGTTKRHVLALMDDNPLMPPAELANLAATRFGISPITAAGYIRAAIKLSGRVVEPTRPKLNNTTRAVEFINAHPHLSKSEILSRLVDVLNTTPAGARTFYCLAIKQTAAAPADDAPSQPKLKSSKTNRDVAGELWRQHPGITRADFIKLAVEQLNLKATTAQTYYYLFQQQSKQQ